MTVETKLAELRMQERELLRTPCAGCGHPLSRHSRVQERACHTWTAHEPMCACKGFVDPGERLAL